MAAIDMLDSFLEQKHCTLWGIKKDIVDPKGRREAAEWLKKTIEDFYEFNSGVPIQLRDPDVDVERLRAVEVAAAEVVAAYEDDSGPDSYGVQFLAEALRGDDR